MFVDIGRYIDFITNHRLTQAQFMMCYLIYRRRYDAAEKYVKAFPSHDGTFIGTDAREDLINRGFLVRIGPDNSFTDLEVGPTFKVAMIDKHEAGNQFWDLYPSIVVINQVAYPLTLMDKYEFRNTYADRIGYDQKEHEEVLKDIEYGKANNLIKCGIEKFLKSEQWSAIRKIRLGQVIPVNETLQPQDL